MLVEIDKLYDEITQEMSLYINENNLEIIQVGDKFKVIPFVPSPEQYKSRRTIYMDAYRKYQAAVNYGEFFRVPAVDTFISRLRDKDWAAFEYIPPQIRYFAGEVGFNESGLEDLML